MSASIASANSWKTHSAHRLREGLLYDAKSGREIDYENSPAYDCVYAKTIHRFLGVPYHKRKLIAEMNRLIDPNNQSRVGIEVHVLDEAYRALLNNAVSKTAIPTGIELTIRDTPAASSHR